jgi:hypothetical protein
MGDHRSMRFVRRGCLREEDTGIRRAVSNVGPESGVRAVSALRRFVVVGHGVRDTVSGVIQSVGQTASRP